MAKLPKISPLRKAWDNYLRRTRLTQKDIAYLSGIKGQHLSKAILEGVASENLRAGLRRANVPEELIPLPNNSRLLADMIYEQRANA